MLLYTPRPEGKRVYVGYMCKREKEKVRALSFNSPRNMAHFPQIFFFVSKLKASTYGEKIIGIRRYSKAIPEIIYYLDSVSWIK